MAKNIIFMGFRGKLQVIKFSHFLDDADAEKSR